MSFQNDLSIITQALQTFYHNSTAGKSSVIQQPPMSELVEKLELRRHVEQGDLSGEELTKFVDTYLSAVTRVHHPANIAHQQAVPHYAAALAGLVDNLVSSDGSIYEFGPASVSIEYFLINWWLEKVGWIPAPLKPQDSAPSGYGGGVLVSGGSLANLTALIAARTQLAPQVWADGNPADLVLLAPAETHYSVARAAGIMGLGHQAVYPLPVDTKGLIIPNRLEKVFAQTKNQGKRVLALIANAGTTAAGLYDPLQEIGSFCREKNIWFHVDGAHGGPALLTPKYRYLTRGIELANSLTINMHKLMRVTAFCTALLVPDASTLDQAFTQHASYLFHDKAQPGFDFLHRTVECTKPVMGLKFFMVLAAMGQAGMASYIEGLFDLTAEIYGYLQSLPDFECPVEPQSNILCFRAKAAGEHQLALREKLLERGNFYISSTELNGQRYLRLTLTNPASKLEHVQALVKEIRTILRGDLALRVQ